MKMLDSFILQVCDNPFIRVTAYMILMDVLFGTMRGLRERKVNSTIGINGIIRKVSMMLCMIACVPIDLMMRMNLIGFIPDEIMTYMPCDKIGMAEIFSLLFLAFEALSVLKNMYLCGLPVKRVWISVYQFLSKYTDELPIKDEDIEMLDKKDLAV